MKKEKITIIGAGLVGSMLAVRLCQLGYEVEIFERRSDIRKEGLVGGRSINLALSNRGIRSLKMIGMDTVADEHAIKMRGRMIHSLEGQLRLLSYSGRQGDFINSIGRGHLNGLILDKLCTYPKRDHSL
ncbi:MAG: NAD(P)-binding protein [Saprospiraceae bacterium]|nr:NAD(P)-binding protein [Saprospiraceae bacterium]